MNTTGIAADDPHHLSGVDDLIGMLRNAHLPIGPAEVIDAARVFRHLAATVPSGEQAASRLKSRLRPVLCKSIADAAVFDDVFDEWYRAASDDKKGVDDNSQGVGDTGKLSDRKVTKIRAWAWDLLKRVTKTRRWLWGLLVALLVVAFLAWMRPWQHDEHNAGSGTILSEPGNNPGPKQPVPSEVPGSDKTATAAPTTVGYFPAVRANEELRQAWWWALLLLPLLAAAPAMLAAPSLPRISRARGGGQVLLQDWPASKAQRDLVAPIAPAVGARLQRHVHDAVAYRDAYARRPLIDPRRTVAATIGNLGIPTLRYRQARLRPAYLVLVAAGGDDAFGILWAQRLRELDMRVDLFRFDVPTDGAVPTCTEVGGLGRRFGFDRLPNPEPGERLVILGPTTALLGNDGRLHDWAGAAQLPRWRQRVLFTPDDPRDWNGDHVQALEQPDGLDPGLLVMPLDDNALAAWSEWLVHGRMPPIVLSEPQRYPRLLREDDLRQATDKHFVGEADPARLGATPEHAGKRVSRLVSELQVYLGENGFYWLCACAVPPLLERRLAILLGEQYFLRCGAGQANTRRYMARSWRRLVRLPWLRDEAQMPQWLRLALLARLPKSVQEELRDVVRGALAARSVTGQGTGFTLQFDDPGRPATQRQDAKPQAATDQRHYALTVGFMRDDLTAEQLMLRIPGAWNRWLPALLHRPPWWRRFGAAGVRMVLRDGIAGRGVSRAAVLLAVAVTSMAALSWGLLAVRQPSDWPASWRTWLYAEVVRPVAPTHDGAVTTVAYSADGSRFVTASRDHTARVWDAVTGRPVGVPMEHASVVRSASFNADGTRVVTASDDGTARIWNVATGKPVGVPLQHDGPVHAARFSADGTRVVTASADRTAHVWDARTGTPVGEPMVHPTAVWSASFTPDGKRVVTTSANTARVWNADGNAGGAKDADLPEAEIAHQGRVWYATPSPDGMRVLTASEDKTVRLTNLHGSKFIEQEMQHDAAVITARFSPDGHRIVTASRDNTARVWNTDTGEPVGARMAHGGPVMSASFSADGKRVVTASDDGTARAWDAATGEPLGEPMRHASGVMSASFSRDANHVVTAARDGTTHVWNGGVNQFLAGPMVHDQLVQSVNYSADGTRLVTASDDNRARIWDAESGRSVGKPMQHDADVYSAEFSPDGSRVITASADGTARVWDAGDGTALSNPITHKSEVLRASFLPDGRRIVTESLNDAVRVWKDVPDIIGGPLEDHEVVFDSQKVDPSHRSARLSTNARYLITSSADGKSRIWAISTGRQVGKSLQLSQGGVVSDVNADGGRALVLWRNMATIWNTATDKPVGEPITLGTAISRAGLSEDGKLLITTAVDGMARVWDTGSGKPVGNIMRLGSGSVERALFSPDGSRVATAGRDGAVRIWDLARGTLIGVPLKGSTGTLADVAWRRDGQRLAISSQAPPPSADLNQAPSVLPYVLYTVRAPQAAALDDDVRRIADRLREGAGSALPANIATTFGLLLLAIATGVITTWRQTRRLKALRPQATT